MAIVYKTLGSEALDAFYSGPAESLTDAYRLGLERMRTHTGHVSDAARDLESHFPPNSADDLERYWLSGSDGDAVARLIERGYEQAIELASGYDPPKPIETFLVAGCADKFELHLSEGKHAVTVFMFVTENRTYGSRRSASRSWVVRAGGPGEHPRASQVDLDVPPAVKLQVSGA